ncbi:hypothetical protein AVEN_159054-1, partial [Araneus ventricosus]
MMAAAIARVLSTNSLSQAMARPILKEIRTIPGGGTQSPTITIPTGE